MESKTVKMAVAGLLAALLCMAGPVSIPVPFTPVPFSFTNFLLFLFLYVFEWKKTMGAYLIYLLLGFCGMPVFSKGQAGASVLLGPTGGFLVGFLFLIVLSGIVIQKAGGRRSVSILGLILGMAVSYAAGLFWFSFQTDTGMREAFLFTVLPFLPVDFVKIAVVAAMGPELKKRMSF